ncbi:hypothetical protein [Marinobacterium aestuariivivens]|uniref:hypothetical protein n=1 Tax=Marinobacterium aestuariivivens TaxID=1698799 RepID=UPI0036D32D61
MREYEQVENRIINLAYKLAPSLCVGQATKTGAGARTCWFLWRSHWPAVNDETSLFHLFPWQTFLACPVKQVLVGFGGNDQVIK